MVSIERLFLVLSISATTHAANEKKVCFANQSEYTTQREKLPSVLKSLPTYLVTDNFLVKAVAALEPGANSVRFFFNASRGIDKAIEDNVRVCASDNLIELVFDNGVIEQIQVQGDTSISVRNKITMEKVTLSRHKNVSDVIQKQKDPIETTTSSAPKRGNK